MRSASRPSSALAREDSAAEVGVAQHAAIGGGEEELVGRTARHELGQRVGQEDRERDNPALATSVSMLDSTRRPGESRRSRQQVETHDDARRRPAYDLLEACPLVERSRPEEHEIVVASFWLVDRIGLKDPDPLRPRMTDRRLQEPVLNTLTTAHLGHVRADH